MKILLVFLGNEPLRPISVNYAVYTRGLQELGYEVLTVCRPGLEAGCEFPLVVPPHEDEFRSVDYWRSFGADAAIALTWLRFGEELGAMRAAGLKTINLTDSDGYATPRSHPGEWLKRMTIYHRGQMKLRTAIFWLKRYLRPREDIERVLLCLEESDSAILHSTASIANLRKFTDRFPDKHLERKLHLVPYPINDLFCEADVTLKPRVKRFVAVGRWDDPQKAAGLLVRTLERYAEQGGTAEVAICGRKGDAVFGPLVKRYPQFKYLGTQTREQMLELYLTSRSVLFTSIWETGPIAVGEALASGCSLVGVPLMNFVTYHLVGPYGRCSPDRDPQKLAEAMDAEMRSWDAGERRPEEIARFWRARLNARTVCRELLATVGIGQTLQNTSDKGELV